MPDNENAGPDFTTFGGAAAAGGIVGSNLLQQVVDKLTRAVDDLSTSSSSLNKAATSMSGAGAGMLGNKGMLSGLPQRGPAGSMSTGMTTFPKVGQTPGLTGSSGSGDISQAVSTFSTAVSQFAAAISKMPGSTGTPASGSGGFPAMGTSQSWSPTSSPTFGGANGGQTRPYSSTSSTGPPPPGGGVPPAQQATMGGANGGGSNFGTAALAGMGAVAGALTSGGRSLMPAELSLNQLSYQTAQTGGRPGNFLQQASGAAGVNPIGALGQNAMDQYQQYAVLQQMAGGQANPMATQVGRFGVQGAGFAQMATPTLSATQAAQQTQQMYLPSTSLRMMQSGFGQASPLIPGGGSRSPTAVIQGMLQRGGPSITPGSPQFSYSKLAQFLSPQGEGFAAMQASGIPTSMIPQILTQAKLEAGAPGGKGMTPQQVQTLTQQASSGNKGQQAQAYKSMQQAGFPKSDIQSLLNMQASKTAETGAVSGGFNAGVQSFASAVTKFNTAVTHMLQAFGGAGGKAVGFGLGLGGSAGTFGLPAPLGTAGEIGGIFGLGHMLGGGGGLLGKVLGGAGGKGALSKIPGLFSKVSGSDGAAGAGAGEEIAGAGAGLGAAGAALGGAAIGIPASIGLDKLLKKVAPGTIGEVLGALSSATGAALEGPKLFGKLMDKISALFKSPVGAAGHLIAEMFGSAKSAVGGIGHDVAHAASGVWHGITNVLGGGAAPPGAHSKKAATATTAPTINTKAALAVKLAKSQIGVPYAYGKEQQGVGFDCSGLVQWAYQKAGIYLPRTANDQWSFLEKDKVSPGKVQEGDVVFTTGAGVNAHEAMLVDQGRHIIEAKGPGQPISMRPYVPAEWQHVARPWTPAKKSTSKNKPARQPSNANVRGGGAGSGSGAQVAAYAQSFATGLNHPYVTGGQGPGGWDCSGFSAYVYEHFGYFPGGQKSRYGTSESQFASSLLQPGSAQPGALVFFNDAVYANPGHVGVMVTSSTYAGADDTKEGTVIHGIGGNVGFRIPKGGFAGGGAAAAAPAAGGAVALTYGRFASQPSMPGAGGSGTGDTNTMGSQSEKSAFTGAIMGGIQGGSGYYGTSTANRAITGVTSGSGAAAPAARGTSGNYPAGGGKGNVPQNAGTIANYLAGMGFNKIAIAGILGNIEQESTGDPNAGSNPPGRGLIQILGDPGGTLAQDLPRMKAYIMANGGIGPVNAATTPTQAAQIFEQKYERAGIPMMANRISSAIASYAAGYAEGGIAPAGSYGWVGERGPELKYFANRTSIMNASQSAKLMKAASAQAPHVAGMSDALVYSTAHPLYQGRSGRSGGGGATNLNFNKGSIVISMPASTSANPTSPQSARVMVQQFCKQLSQVNLDQAIKAGVNS